MPKQRKKKDRKVSVSALRVIDDRLVAEIEVFKKGDVIRSVHINGLSEIRESLRMVIANGS